MIKAFIRWLLCCLASIFGVRCEPASPPWGSEPRFPPPVPRTTRPVAPQVLVFLDNIPGIDLETATEAEVLAKLRTLPDWQQLEAAFGPVSLRRTITLDRERLNRIVDNARKNAQRSNMRGYDPRFRNYFYVVPSRSSAKPEDLYCASKGLTGVKFARFVAPAKRAASAGYLQPPPQGVHAIRADGARAVTPADVADVALIDIEKAWPASTPGGYITLPTPRMETGVIDDIAHGIASYGASVAHADPAVGIAGGIAPGAKFYRCPYLSAADPTHTPTAFLASAILGCVDFIQAEASATPARLSTTVGHVILIEQETDSSLPVEVEPDVFDAIRTATLNNLIVVEPAGNGWSDLGDVAGAMQNTTAEGVEIIPRMLNGADPTLRSGAILVAAGHSGDAPFSNRGERHDFSNFGNIIDCWAWGDSVHTYTATIVGPDVVVRDDPAGYSGTSAAAAIVAGVVVAMQGLQIRASRPRLTELQVRPMLQTLGTNGVGDLASKKMPDLGQMSPKPSEPIG
jgi:hypothetical protein